MAKYIDADALAEKWRARVCADCERRKGKKNGKIKFVYEIGEAPCKACWIADMLDEIEDAPTADVQEVRHGKWEQRGSKIYCTYCNTGFAIRYGARPMSVYPYCPVCGSVRTNVAKMVGGGKGEKNGI